jgi:8-amino-7-oxononanoate synthase
LYEKELKAIKKSNRFRQRVVFDENLIDFASNDYLGIAENSEVFEKSFTHLREYKSHSAKASSLVNGYHPSHKLLEDYLCEVNGFEAGIIVGSGFLANLSIFEALGRKKDLIVLDDDFHASGNMGVELSSATIRRFSHNNLEDLKLKLEDIGSFERVFVAVEGVYSMMGDLVTKEILDFVLNLEDTILIIDEAHSVGVVGENLRGVVELYNLPTKNIIKMGTLGKAIGSYGAYILASYEVISFLENRAKGIIYTTALSPADTIMAYYGFKYIEENLQNLQNEIKIRQNLLQIESLIYIIENYNLLEKKEELLEKGYLVGAIRPPTVKTPIFRVIPRINESIEHLKEVLRVINE